MDATRLTGWPGASVHSGRNPDARPWRAFRPDLIRCQFERQHTSRARPSPIKFLPTAHAGAYGRFWIGHLRGGGTGFPYPREEHVMKRTTLAALTLLLTFGIVAHAWADPLADEM